MKKGWRLAAAIILTGAIGIACLIWFVFYLTSGVVESADRFLGAVGHNDLSAAWQQTSAEFQRQQALDEFAAIVGELGLGEFESATWYSRSIKNGIGRVAGTIHLKSGGPTKLSLTLVRENQEWRVQSLEGPPIGARLISSDSTESTREQPGTLATDWSDGDSSKSTVTDQSTVERTTLPEWEVIAPRVAHHLNGLALALENQDFTAFHASIAQTWQSQITPAQFAAVFQSIRDMPRDWAPVDRSELVLDESMQLEHQGILVAKGHVPHGDRRLVFETKFVAEPTGWELFGIMVREITEPPPPPSDEELQRLVRSTLSEFQRSVLKNNFASLFEQASSFFRAQYTPAQLQTAFHSFIDQQIDLSEIAQAPLVFTQPIEQDRMGTIDIKGHSDLAVGKLEFSVSYIYETDAWKLMAIGVNLR